jgi:hypothetical protein
VGIDCVGIERERVQLCSVLDFGACTLSTLIRYYTCLYVTSYTSGRRTAAWSIPYRRHVSRGGVTTGTI